MANDPQVIISMVTTIGVFDPNTILLAAIAIVPSTIAAIRSQRNGKKLETMQGQFETNGGGTLRDQSDRLERAVVGLVRTQAEQTRMQTDIQATLEQHTGMFRSVRNALNSILLDHIPRAWSESELRLIRENPSERCIVLVVDDEPDVGTLVKAVLRGEFEVVYVDSARAALRFVQDHDVAVVMTDQKMPEMTGSELLEKLVELYPTPVRLLITAHSDIESLEAAIKKGHIYRHIKKPWVNEELLAIVREAAANYRVLRAAGKRLGLDRPQV